MTVFEVASWALPVKAGAPVSGWGSSLVAVPGTSSVILSLSSGGPRSPWCIVDLSTGETLRGTGMPGDLRAVVFPNPGADDQRPWVLATYGLGRLQRGSRPAVVEVVRKGIGKYRSALLDIDRDRLGVGHHLGGSLLMVSKSDGSPVKRIRVPGPDVAYRLPNGRLRVLGFHHAQASDVDTDRLRVTDRHVLPHGAGAHHADGRVIALLGSRRDIRMVDDAGQLEPDEPIVLRAGQPQDDEPDLGWNVAPTEIAVLDPWTLEIQQRAKVPPRAVEVLGLDRDGRVVVSTHNGFVLLDPDTLTVTASYRLSMDISGATLCAGHNVVALLGGVTADAVYSVQWNRLV